MLKVEHKKKGEKSRSKSKRVRFEFIDGLKKELLVFFFALKGKRREGEERTLRGSCIHYVPWKVKSERKENETRER